jgi:antitoxin CptB
MSEHGAEAPRLQRLRWQCRRGMLELDLLLNNYLDQVSSDLTDAQGRLLERLLAVEDQILVDWLLGEAVPAEPALGAVVSQIRSAMRPS